MEPQFVYTPLPDVIELSHLPWEFATTRSSHAEVDFDPTVDTAANDPWMDDLATLSLEQLDWTRPSVFGLLR